MTVLTPHPVIADQSALLQTDSATEEDAFADKVCSLCSRLWAEKDNHQSYEQALAASILLILPKASMPDLYDAVPKLARNMVLSDVFQVMANLGFVSYPVKISFGQIEPRLAPCIFMPRKFGLTRKSTPLIVLKVVSEEGRRLVHYFDTATNRTNVADQRDSIFKTVGTAHFLRRENIESQATSSFQRKATKHTWFRALLTRFSREFVCTVILSLFINVLTLATPLFIMLVYDRVISVKAVGSLPALAVGAVAGIIFEWMLRTYRGRVISWVAARIDWLVGTHIVEKLFSLPPVYAEKATVSSQIARIKAFEAVRDFFAGSAFYSVIELPFVLIALSAIGFVAGPLVLVPLAMIVPFLALYYVMRRKIAVAMRVAAKLGSMRQKFLIASLGLVEQIDASGLASVWQKKHRSLTGREQISRLQLSWLTNIAEACAQALLSISAALTLTVGAFLVWNGTISAGGLVASMILVWRILSPLYSLCTSISRFEQINNSIRQVNQLMEIEGESETRSGARLKSLKGAIEFDNTSVRYSVEAPPVLSGLSFNADPGSLILVTGESGAGKTSILKLVQGLYAAQSGSVRIDGFDVRQLDLRYLRRQVAYVPQSADFFDGTILENMRLVKPDATEQEIWEMLGSFMIATEIRALPEELGTRISRIKSMDTLYILNLARAFLKETNLILIDKLPDTLLSGASGSAIKRMIMRQHGRKTIVMVSSRADFLDLADLAILLRRNQRPQVGVPEDLSQYFHVHSNAAVA